jgi:hypothetical protein
MLGQRPPRAGLLDRSGRCGDCNSGSYQRFPKTGVLAQHANLDKNQLIQTIKNSSDVVYAYVMKSVKLVGGCLQHGGCGPNIEGGFITLCTCKHRMRTYLSCDDWRGKWIAGFTSVKCGGRQWLFYLARVREAYESHSELWNALPAAARRVKSARNSELGDLYEPKRELAGIARFDPAHYHTPVAGHNHHNEKRPIGWHIDIDYGLSPKVKQGAKRKSSLLIADPQLSFLWEKPRLYKNAHWRQRNRGLTLETFLDILNQKP